jgi:hypothetical protein
VGAATFGARISRSHNAIAQALYLLLHRSRWERWLVSDGKFAGCG